MSLQKIDALLESTYRENEYPVLLYQTRTWSETLPLKGITVLDASPVFRNTLLKYRALIAAGARLIVGVTHVMPCDESIVELLLQAGIPVVRASDTPLEVDIILDCAASFVSWSPRIGFVELTRSGVEKFSNVDKPVFVADDGVIKRIETTLGTGESYFRAMRQLGYDHWAGRKLVVFGSGKVGEGIILYALKMDAEVVVVTHPNTVTQRIKDQGVHVIHYTNSDAIAYALRDAYAVVTATGVPNALETYVPVQALIHSPALLANMGVEDEFGSAIPKERVLMEKKTLNFFLDEPTHLKYIDATMALHNQGAIYLIEHPQDKGLIKPPQELENELLNICRRYGCIGDELDWI